MAIERTLSIIKPDGVEKGIIGRIVSRFESQGLKPVAMRMARLSQAEAEGFYAVHKARPFFNDLVKFMTSGPVVLMVLEGEGAVAKNRDVMGATDPRKAAEGTIRKDFATDIEKNTVHGSDSPENARIEVTLDVEKIPTRDYRMIAGFEVLDRETPPTLDVGRRTGIAEVETGYDPASAGRQGSRCLLCHVQSI